MRFIASNPTALGRVWESGDDFQTISCERRERYCSARGVEATVSLTGDSYGGNLIDAGSQTRTGFASDGKGGMSTRRRNPEGFHVVAATRAECTYTSSCATRKRLPIGDA